MSDRRYVTIQQTAAYSGLSVRTIQNLLQNGHLTPLRPAGAAGRTLVDLHEVDELIRAGAHARGTRGRYKGSKASPISRA